MSEIGLIEGFLKDNQDYVQEKYADKGALTVTQKTSASDLLTEVDLTVQKRFVDKVESAFPGDVIVGEEGDLSRFPDDPEARAWLIDPIDGTYNFVRGLFPVFGVSIAFMSGGLIQAGGVLLPMMDELFLAERGSGAFRNGERLQVSGVQQLSEACIDVDFCEPGDRKHLFKRCNEVLLQAGQLRCRGAAVVSICQIASADIEGYVHMNLTPWDFAAAQLIVEEAQGVASRLDGSPLRPFDRVGGILLSNGAVHQELVDLLRV